MRSWSIAAFFVFLSLTSASAQEAALSPEVKPFVNVNAARVALQHVRVIDGTGAAARDDQTVVIANGKIEYAGPYREEKASGTQVLDLNGYTLIPGLVGMHDHMFYPTGEVMYHEMGYSFPRLYLAAGVTSLRTTGSLEPYTDLELKKQIDAGQSPGPKIHVTGPYLEGPGTFSVQMHQITSPEDAVKTVNFWADQGVTSFKAYNFLTRAQLGAAIQAAHKRGIKVTGHLCSIGYHEAIALGIDNLEHGLSVDTEFFPDKKPDVCPDETKMVSKLIDIPVSDTRIQGLIKDLVDHHVAITSTLPVFEVFVAGRPPLQQRLLDALAPEARDQYLEARVRISTPNPARYGPKGPPWPAMFEHEKQFEHDFAKAGGLLLAGLDPTGAGGVIAGFGDQREIELLVETGFTPLEAIHIATSNGAEFLGELDRIGTIAAGKAADLVVIHGDPSTKVEDIEKVETVFKDGIGYDSAKLIESVRGHVGMN